MRRGVPLISLLAFFQFGALLASEDSVDFESQVAPIFQEHCVGCHSDESKKGDLSLSTIADLKSLGDIIPGDPEGSHLLELIVSANGQPPEMPKEAESLTEQQVELIRRWIADGAEWPESVIVKAKPKANENFWSLQPLSVPETGNLEGPAVIDELIHKKLVEQGLTRSPRADRRTLIRRLSFDLHGLPPSPSAVESFVNDPDPHAYEKLVDRMLSSPHYGERLAQHWLDLAHYADTHGFERDKRRDNAWRYRDYVIRAFNEDKPYDRFLQEQIAGDILWPDDEQAVVATGFLAAGPWDFVGQVETKSPLLRRAARSLDLDDMATQVMTATMGITINCARCHDHKLDPITQKEYYQLRAVFAGVERKDRVVSDEAVKEYESRKQELTAKRNAVDFEIGKLEGQGINLADIVGGGTGLGGGKYRQGIDARTGKVQTRDFGDLGHVVTNKFSATSSQFIDGVFIPDGKEGTAQIPVSSTGITVTGLPKTSGKAWDMIRNGPVASQHSPKLGGIDFKAEGHSLLGMHANSGITFDLSAIREASKSSRFRFSAKLGYFGAEGDYRGDAWIYVDGREVARFSQLSRKKGLQSVNLPIPETASFLTLIVTDGGNGYGHDQFGFGDPQLQSIEPIKLSTDDQQRLTMLRGQRQQISQQLSELGPPPMFYGVVAHQEVPEIRVLNRGNPEAPNGNPLEPGALQSLKMLDPDLGDYDSSAGERRAALAKWITNPKNPLTARVIANRLWHWHFGTGIVDTPSDFGYGGGRPSHPELLDWLAAELPKQGWSLKEMHRLILLSETYRQQSRYSEDHRGISVDADNRLLWRQNPHRLDAETIRDAVLFVSGQLNDKLGGPGFEDFNYQDAYAPIYKYITADEPDLWRRSIYRFVVRTTPNNFLTTFDCPDPANLTAKRLSTTTPLQSLALYNNEFMLKQAEYFAERVRAEVGSLKTDQIRRAFELTVARTPSTRETDLALSFVDREGLFALCRSLLNSNEFLYID